MQNKSRFLALVVPSIVILSTCQGQQSSHEFEPGAPTNFPTVGFEQSHKVLIAFPVDEVTPLFEPDGRHLVYDWWNPKILREGEGGTPSVLFPSTFLKTPALLISTSSFEYSALISSAVFFMEPREDSSTNFRTIFFEPESCLIS